MKNSKNFPFERARRVSTEEVDSARKAIEAKTGNKRVSRGRPLKSEEQKFVPTSIRLHPQVIAWAKKEAKKRGVGYQTIINEILLAKAV
jgi:uncharacterized protein (DUF4415 family)